MRSYTISILNSEYKVLVFVGDRLTANKAICKYLGEKQNFIEDSNRGKSVYKKGFHPCLWIDPKLKGKDFYATLAHEAIHGVVEIMLYIGMNIKDVSGDEFLAHSVAAIIKVIK